MEKPSELVRGFYQFCMECINKDIDISKNSELPGKALSFKNAFWKNFISLAISTFDDDAEYEIKLSEVFRVYLTIYKNKIDRNMCSEETLSLNEHQKELSFLKHLKDVYDEANRILHEEEDSKVGLRLARLILKEEYEEINVARLLSLSLNIVSSAVACSHIPFKLIEDFETYIGDHS